MAKTPGITARGTAVPAASRETGGRCNCTTAYEAWVLVEAGRQRRIPQNILREGRSGGRRKAWRFRRPPAQYGSRSSEHPPRRQLRKNGRRVPWGAEKGEILATAASSAYKPSVVRQYRSALEKRVPARVRGVAPSQWLSGRDLLALKERLLGEGIADSTIRDVFVPVQAVFRRARKMGDVALNPAEDLELPTGETRTRRAVTPKEAAALVDALPETERSRCGRARSTPACAAGSSARSAWWT